MHTGGAQPVALPGRDTHNLPVNVGSAKSLLDNDSEPTMDGPFRCQALTPVLEATFSVEVDETVLSGLVSGRGSVAVSEVGVSMVAKVTTFLSLASAKDSSVETARFSPVLRGVLWSQYIAGRSDCTGSLLKPYNHDTNHKIILGVLDHLILLIIIITTALFFGSIQ